MTFEYALKEAMDHLRSMASSKPTMWPNVRRLEGCEITRKPWWHPTSHSASTTVGSHKIYLARDWREWAGGVTNRARNLFHESVHSFQADPYSDIEWQFKYITSKAFRQAVEANANFQTAKYFK